MSDQNNKINKKAEIDLAELLKKDAPYLVEDGKVNLVKLDGLLSGKITEKEDDRFYFNWAGKDKVFQAIQAPAYSTLAPQKDKSIGWDETENLMIVGENLETLKLLLKPYFGKVKVIYIDPPYNKDKDFIYVDDFSIPLKEYLARTNQLSESGQKLTSNPETNGRYHSDWISMMYSRLFTARNLLKEDGVIFVSIGDEEVHHLRMVMDEIFGEDNFEGHIHWRRRHNQPNDKTKMIGLVGEHILAYAKNSQELKKSGVGKVELTGKFSNPDNDPRGDWASKPWKVGTGQSGTKYRVTTPTGKEYDEEWMGDEANFKKLLADNRIIFPDKGNGTPRKKYFKFEREEEGQCATNWWGHEQFGSNQDGSSELADLFDGLSVFDNPKPAKLIKNLVAIGNVKENDIVLDFFAGSGSTGQAIFELLNEDKKNYKFLLVQLDEAIDDTKESGKNARQLGLNTVAEVCLDRLKRLSSKNAQNLKYKVFKLSPSNFNLKEEFELTENKDLGELKTNYLKELGLYVDQPTVATANTLDIVYEIILKNGFSLNSKIEELKLGSNNFYKVSDTENELEIHISLDAKIEDGSVEAIRTTEYKGKTFAFYDNALTDSQKINLNTFVKLQVI